MLKNHRATRLAAFISVFFVIAIAASSASAQLTGTRNVPGDYADLASAVADLNLQGVGAGGVTINLVAGNPQTAPAGGYIIGGAGSLVLTTASAANPIVFNGNGNTITASAALTAGVLHDSIFELVGADWVTISGFVMNENAANTTTAAATNNMTEWGVSLFYVTTTDGAQNNTITGNTIDLNRTYQNTFGIYANATHTSTVISTSATATGALGGNHGLTITANNITDVNNGIVVVGPTAAVDYNNGVTIGGTAPNANTITNYGTTGTFSSYANVSGTVNGVLVRNSINANVSFNSITSSVGGVTSGTLNGIQFPAFSNSPTVTFTQNINSNTLNLQSGAATGAINGLNLLGTSSSATSIINVNSNSFNNFGHTVASSGTITFLIQSGGHFTQSISGNVFNSPTVNTTGSVTFISSSTTLPAGGTKTVSNHTVNGFTKTGAGGTITFYTDNGSSPTGTTTNVTNNTFSNITITGITSVTGISDTDGGAPNKNVMNNTISNISGGTTGTIIGITTNFDGGTTVISGNTISDITNGGAITGILTGTSGSGGALTTNISQNTIHTFTGTGTGAVIGVSLGGTTGHIKNASRNKIYNLENNNAGGSTNGILVSSGVTINLFNNLVGDIRTPAVNAANSLIGISITGGTTVNGDFNTVYLNGSSTGALFGSSAISVSTTPTVTLRNNIFVNLSSTTGAGLAAAHRRSSTTLTSYAAASNNNDFFGSTIFTDGTNTDATLAAYKARVAGRDSASVTENPAFLSTSGASANFLHINAAVPTQLESGGVTVAGITTDFDGDARNVTTPDIGADEFTGIAIDLAGPNITYTNLLNTSSTGDRILNITVTDPSGVPTLGAGLPVIYYRKNAGAYASTQCSFVSGSTYECYIVAAAVGGVTTGDIIGYYVAAQDNANNVSVNPSAGAAGLTANPPAAATPPTTPNQYTIVAAASGTYTVGTGGTYPSLTNTGGVFEFLNSSEVTGNINIEILSDLAGELGTHALNQYAGAFTTTLYPCSNPVTITGSNTGALIRLNGADNVTINGDSNACSPPAVVGGTPASRHLTIQNTNTGTSAVVISVASNGTNGAQNNTIQNVSVLGQDPLTSLIGISLGGATPGTVATGPNNNNRVDNCFVGRTIFGIYSAGRVSPDQNTGTVITQNETSAVVGDRVRRVGIVVFNENGVQITENSINGISTNESADGIGIGVGTQGIDTTNTTSGGVINALVERNKINGVASLSTTGFSAAGITVAGGTGGANTVRNNMITGVTAPSTSPDIVAGIYVVGAAGSSTRLYHNSISMTGDRGTVNSQMPSYGVAITGADPTVELKNNIVYSTQTANCTTPCPTAESYGIGMVTTTFVNLDSNYNAFFTNSLLSQDGGYRSGSLGLAAGTDYDTLLAWQTAVSDDANSQDVNPVFVNPANDLHLAFDGPAGNPDSPLIGDGLTGFAAVDYDNDPRPATAPEIGADELVQSTGGSFPAGIFYNAISAPGDQMAGSVTITNSITLNGILNTGNFNTLTMGCNATFANAGGGNYVVGTVNKEYCGTGAFTYPVGTTPDNTLAGGKGEENGIPNPPEYTPVSVNVTGGTFPSFLSVRVFDGTLIGFDPANSLSRNWELNELGDITADLSFTYLDGAITDVNGTEANYIAYRRNANGTTDPMCLGACVDTVNNILGPVTGVTQFSRWSGAALAPTAAGVNVSGRVLVPGGGGLRNATVTLTDARGVTQTSRSTTFGYYKFEDVRVGETYVLDVNSKRYVFTPRTVQVLDEVTGLDITAEGER